MKLGKSVSNDRKKIFTTSMYYFEMYNNDFVYDYVYIIHIYVYI